MYYVNKLFTFATELQIKYIMENKAQKTLKEFFVELEEKGKRQVIIDLQLKLRRPYSTVYCWMMGKRNIASPTEADIVCNYIRDNYQIEIIKEGGKA